MVDVNQEGEQQKPTPRKQGERPFLSENSEQNSQNLTSSSSVDNTPDDKPFQQHENNKAMESSLEKKHSKNKYEDHCLVGNNKKEKPSSTTSSSPASPSSRRIKDQHSFESQVQPGYKQTHFQRDVGTAEGGDQSFSSSDTSVQGHTQKEENIRRDDALEAPNRTTTKMKVECKTTPFGKRYHTESNLLRNQGSNFRNNETYYDYLIQQVERGRREADADQNEPKRQPDASVARAQISFVNSKRHASDTDANKIQTKDNYNKERLSDAERQQDTTRSSSPHRSDSLQSIPTTSPPLHHDISENRMNINCKDNDNENTTHEEASGRQITIPISKNAPIDDQAVEERLQKQDTSNDKKPPPNDQEDDYRTKVRNRARNRRRNAAEQNKKRQEEITRLTKANFELKEKNQAMINELVTLGVDALTIQLFLNSTHSTNQQSSVLVPPPTYNLSSF